jgi:hypothetical protein
MLLNILLEYIVEYLLEYFLSIDLCDETIFLILDSSLR